MYEKFKIVGEVFGGGLIGCVHVDRSVHRRRWIKWKIENEHFVRITTLNDWIGTWRHLSSYSFDLINFRDIFRLMPLLFFWLHLVRASFAGK